MKNSVLFIDKKFCVFVSFIICCGMEARASIVLNIEWVKFVL